MAREDFSALMNQRERYATIESSVEQGHSVCYGCAKHFCWPDGWVDGRFQSAWLSCF